MRFLALFSAAVVSLSQLGEATIIYSLSPASQSIVQGSVGLFNLSVRTDVAGGQQINGLEANVVSNAPNSFFTVASQTLMLNNGPIDRSTPGQAFISNFLPAGFSLGTTDTLFARLFLSTTNVATGPYSISLNQLAETAQLLLLCQSRALGQLHSRLLPCPNQLLGYWSDSVLWALFCFDDG